MRNLAQIRELQKYVNILRDANLDPDAHLTEEQKELLLSAEYYDRLNAATAYFPGNLPPQALMNGFEQQNLLMLQEYQQQQQQQQMEEGEDEEEEEDDGQVPQGQIPQGLNHHMMGAEPIEEN